MKGAFTMVNVIKEIEALNALTAGLEAIHKAALDLLETMRRTAGKCVSCGIKLDPELHEEEYCSGCYQKWINQQFEERKNPDGM